MNNFNNSEKKHIFIIGCKGIPARYGGFETFVENLTKYNDNSNIQYHVACAVDELAEDNYEYVHNDAHCFNIQWRNLGSARAVFYDIDALKWCIDYIKKNNIKNPIIYILACRIGPFISKYRKQIHALGGQLFVNPDGHEWKRSKWSKPVQMYWKLSEKLMVKNADFLICDSQNIESYIKQSYSAYSPKTTFIAYGADVKKSDLADNDEKFLSWLENHGLRAKNYYLVVGRFVPENNYETMIREFMTAKTDKDFVIITDTDGSFYDELKSSTHFDNDKRIKFVGTVYDQQLLKKIREGAYAYLHGHEVGGTNPSLLEALASTRLNLLLDVGFNREVAEEGAIYWSKDKGDLANLISKADDMADDEVNLLSQKARKRIEEYYSWEYIVKNYEKVFL